MAWPIDVRNVVLVRCFFLCIRDSLIIIWLLIALVIVRSIPFILLMAAHTQRIFLIHWQHRPAPLEAFLEPSNRGSIDWRMPNWMQTLSWQAAGTFHRTDWRKARHAVNVTFVDTKYQAYQQGAKIYNDWIKTGEPNHNQVLRNLWHRLFRPVPVIQRMIEEKMLKLELVEGQYTSVQIRSRYMKQIKDIESYARNALKCAQMLLPNHRIYVTSDSLQARKVALDLGRSSSTKLISTLLEEEPLHLDRGRSYLQHPHQPKRTRAKLRHNASDYHSVFQDLFILSKSRCVAYDRGGFGMLGSLLSFNSSCSIPHNKNACPKAATAEATQS